MMIDCSGMPTSFSLTTAPSALKSPSGRGMPESPLAWAMLQIEVEMLGFQPPPRGGLRLRPDLPAR